MVVGISGIYAKTEVDDLFGHYLAQNTPLFDGAANGVFPAPVLGVVLPPPPQIPTLETIETLLEPTSEASSSSSDSDSKGFKRKRETSKKTAKPQCETERKERRRLQNRMAAATSREKKKKYHSKLEGQVEELSDENTKLQNRIQELLAENQRLKEQSQTAHTPTNTSTTPVVTIESAAGGDDKYGCLPGGFYAPSSALTAPIAICFPAQEHQVEIEEGCPVPNFDLPELDRQVSSGSDCFSGLFYSNAGCSFESLEEPTNYEESSSTWLVM